QAAADSVAETFELFAGLGAGWVNVHIVHGIGMFERAESLRWQGEIFAQLAERAAPYGLGIMVEHPPDAACGVSEIRGILEADARLGFHLDVGHANVGGDRLEGLLNNFGPRLAHVHLSDNRGRNDDHLPLGAGRINWPRAVSLLKRAGYDGTLTLEVFSEDRDLLLWSAERVRGWWGR
nr:sugar phosphate isomerase/epimerase [Chloroflexaceae bacterium]